MEWRTDAPKDKMPSANYYYAADVTTFNTPHPYLKTTRSPIMPSRAESELLSGGRHMDLFNLISALNPTKDAPTTAKSVSDPDPLSYAKPQPYPERDIAQSSRKTATEIPTGNVATREVQGLFSAESPESGKSTSFTSVDGSPGGIYQPGWGVTNNCCLDTPDACHDMVDHIVPPGYFSELRHLPNTDFLSQYNINLARQVAMGSQLRLSFKQEVRLLKKSTARIARRDQRIQAREEEIKKLDQEIKSLRTVEAKVHDLHNQTKNLETLLEAEVDMKKAAEAKNAGLAKELESLRVQFSDLQRGARPVLRGESGVREIDLLHIRRRVARRYLSAGVGRDQQLLLVHPGRVAMGPQLKLRFKQEVRLLKKATARIARWDQRIQAREEERKKLDQEIKSLRTVEAERCAEMDARLHKLSVDFDEELYPHMLTAIAGRRWIIGHGLRLAVMKCAESLKLRQAFADVVSARLVKGMSEGLKHSIEHGKAGRDLAAVEAYNLEAYSKYVKALQDLKDLKYPLVDQLERLKDAPMELIMASLHLESDSREDAPQWIRDLRPSFSQLKIPIYAEVCDLEDPWAFKEEMLLEDAIAANISRAEKKKKCKVVCRTHGISSAHHARSDGIPVSVPTLRSPGAGDSVGGCRYTDRGG
ncbi:hypothetical protein Tco_0280628 [Tanacetum coccineum]